MLGEKFREDWCKLGSGLRLGVKGNEWFGRVVDEAAEEDLLLLCKVWAHETLHG